MKELTKYSRLAGYLEKLYDKLNADFFDGELDRPVITIQSSSRSYGHYTLYDAWSVKGEGHKEINIAAGTLNRPIEYTVCTLLHEMCHQYNNEIANIQDCSRGGTYHNKYFKQTAEAHGLIVTRSEKYGWSLTSPTDELLDWILNNDIQEIKLNRNEYQDIRIAGGQHRRQRRGEYIVYAHQSQSPLCLPCVQKHCPQRETVVSNLRRLYGRYGGGLRNGEIHLLCSCERSCNGVCAAGACPVVPVPSLIERGRGEISPPHFHACPTSL